VSIKIELSVGELLDKITILQIKSERIDDESKLENINKELHVLQSLWNASPYSENELDENISELKAINEDLWDIEDKIRDKESEQAFDQGFIALARSVYFTNDKRAEIKRVINSKTGSELIEEKSYSDYSASNTDYT
jgi:flagellar motility protein MotE (MotC chaperone)